MEVSMALRFRIMTTALILGSCGAIVAAGVGTGCTATQHSNFGGAGGGSATSIDTSGPGQGGDDVGGFTWSAGPDVAQQGQTLLIMPQDPVLTYSGSPVSQQFDATVMGTKVNANWSID